MERETGVEPATSTLARSHSTTELFPLSKSGTISIGKHDGCQARIDINLKENAKALIKKKNGN